MRRFLLIPIMCLLVLNLYAQNTQSSIDSLDLILSERIEKIESSIKDLYQGQVQIKGRLEKADHKISAIKEDVSAVDSKTHMNEAAITDLSDSVSLKIGEATETYQYGQDLLFSSINSRTLLGGTIALLLGLVVVVLFLFLRKRINNGTDAVESIRTAQKNLQEESLKLDEKLIDIFDAQLKLHKENFIDRKIDAVDHSLALKVADELTRIETNLSRMDSSVRGYKQLAASLKRIKDNYMANGYEIVDMLGKPYNDGMKVIANFVPDESLKEGEQIITSIVKPQINYKGQMIQAAQITVSQN